jgi:hypothetical protein
MYFDKLEEKSEKKLENYFRIFSLFRFMEVKLNPNALIERSIKQG